MITLFYTVATFFLASRVMLYKGFGMQIFRLFTAT